jgi:hypothetical protein
VNLERLRKNSRRSPTIRRATTIGVINWMDTQLITLLMFLLLTYLLFRRPASAASRRGPTELNLQISHSAHLNSDGPGKKLAQSPGWNGVSRSFLRRVSPGLALIPLLSVFAMAQSPAGAQAGLAAAGNVSRSGKEDKEDKKDGGAANNNTKNGKDNAELVEEMRRMRQLIEKLEARVNQLEAEKSAAAPRSFCA